MPGPLESKLGRFTAAILALNTLVFLVFAVFFARACVRGVLSWRTCKGWIAWAWVGYVVLLGCLFLVMSRDLPETLRDDIRSIGLVLLVYAAVAWLRLRVAQAQRRTAEKLQGIEQRLEVIGKAVERSVDPDYGTRVTNRIP